MIFILDLSKNRTSLKLFVHFSILSNRSIKYHLSNLLWLNCRKYSKLLVSLLCCVAIYYRFNCKNLLVVSRMSIFSHSFFKISLFSGFYSSFCLLFLWIGSYFSSNFSMIFLRFLCYLDNFSFLLRNSIILSIKSETYICDPGRDYSSNLILAFRFLFYSDRSLIMISYLRWILASLYFLHRLKWSSKFPKRFLVLS